MRDKAEAARGRAAEHEEFMKEIGQQAQDLLDDMNWQGGFGGGRNRGVGGGGDDDTAWWDKTWYEGNLYETDFSYAGTAFSAAARNVGTSLANTAADMAMPWRRVERAVADYEADVARDESAFDAGLNAFGKNAPLVSAGYGLGEAIEGRTRGGGGSRTPTQLGRTRRADR